MPLLEKSTGLATYHLNKLNDLKLLRKDADGIYHVIPKRFGVLRFFVIVGKWIVPRTFFYTLFFAVWAVCFLYWLPIQLNVVTFTLALIPTLINFIETILFYKALSSKR